MDYSISGFLVLHYLLEFAKIHSIELIMLFKHHIVSNIQYSHLGETT